MRHFPLALVLLFAVSEPSHAQTATLTFPSSPAHLDIPKGGIAPADGKANPYPSTINVSGFSAGSRISKLVINLSEFTHPWPTDIWLLLESPSGQQLVIMDNTGSPDSAWSISPPVTLTLKDDDTTDYPYMPLLANPISGTTYNPTVNDGGGPVDMPDVCANCPLSHGNPQAPGTTYSLADKFNNIDPNGQWKLYALDFYFYDGIIPADTGGGLSWSLTITAANPTTATTIASSSAGNQSWTGNSVTFTATVTNGGSPVNSGTVTFKEGATTLSGPTALNASGQATFTTTALTEGRHTITAEYSGAAGYDTSNGQVTQSVDDTTTVTGVRFCNPGVHTLPASGTAAAYPLRVYVSGVTQPISTMKVSLDGFTYPAPNALQMMLVSPVGTAAKGLDFFSHTANASAVTSADLIFADSAATTVPTGIQLAPESYQPTSTSATNTWAAPAPAGPYQFAAPAGSYTFSSVFNGGSANGWWSLYIASTGAGSSGSMGQLCIEFGVPDLTVTKSHSGDFYQGQTGALYTIHVSNSGTGPSSGLVTVTDTLPAGLTATALSGTGWSCTLGTLTCTRSNALAPGASYEDIALTVNVASNAAASVTNSVTVSGGGDSGGDSATDPTAINAIADLTVAKTHAGDFSQGQAGATYTIIVTNTGTGATSGTVTLAETEQSGFTTTGISGTGWGCVLGTLTCTRTDALAAGASYPPITVTVDVKHDAPAVITNSVTVSGGGEANTSNNIANDPTTILGSPDLTVSKAHAGNFRQGQTGATYTITVSNPGRGATTGQITVTDTLPAGLTATAMSGMDWTCTLGATPACTRTAALAAGGSSAIALTVDVASNAAASITNTVTVSGGGESNTGNDTASDPTTVDQVADLVIAKSHTGDFQQGQTGATYTMTVTNSGPGPTTGQVTVTDSLPAGLTATGLNGTGWSCVLGTLNCTRSDVLNAGSSYPVITLTLNVAANAAASITNTVTVSGGGELNTANDTASDPTTIVQYADLTISKTHSGNFRQGQTGAEYTITVTNTGQVASSGLVTVTDTLPAGFTATAMAGTGWTCTAPTCTRSDALAAGASYPPITLTVDVASDAAPLRTNTATVAGGGEIVTGNDTATDPTTVTQVADLQVTKSHAGNFRQGQTGATYTITVGNIGPGPTTGVVTVTDTLPPALTVTGMSGSGWTCTAPTCTRNDVLAAGASYPAITLTVNVAAGAPVSLTNNVVVSGGGELNTTNNSASDATTVDQAADLQISKSHAGDFTQGQTGAYTVVVTNTGPGPTVGMVTVSDSLPAGLTAVVMTGTGWACASPTCTRNDVLASGSSYPAITVTANVAGNAPANVTNTVTVSGGGELDTSNDSASDPTTIVQIPDLAITKSHTGHFTRGQTGAYTITVSNSGSAATSGIVTVADTLPAGLTAAAISGSGWGCTLTPLSCTRSDALAVGNSYPPITLTVNVATDAPTPVANSATVTGTADANPANNTAIDVTTVLVIPDITWANPAAITYGTPLGGTQLNASSTVPGTFAYSPEAGVILAAGPHTLNVTFTPADTNVYAPATATVNLTVNKATPAITWTDPAPILYGTALSATHLNAATTVPGSFVYSPAAGTVLATGSHTLAATFTPTDTANYNGATASVTQVVNKATPAVAWTDPAPIAYGTALSATQLNATSGVPGSFVYSPPAGTVLATGTHTLNVAFTPTDTANYNGATASVTVLVNKATPAITWATPAAIIYGTALSAAQLNATSGVPGSFVYSPPAGTVLSAGSQTLNVTFTPTDTGSYANANASVTLLVNKATPTVAWATPAAITYGTALGATQLNATAGVPGSFAYSPAAGTVLPAGNNILAVTFTPTDTDNYNTASASVTLPVNKATPSVTWANPAPITYGTVLGPAQLNATASVDGSFTYSPAGGATLPAGSDTLSATFTPTDSANYSSATASVTQVVNKATPTITWPTPGPISPGIPLGPAQLNATASTAGTFVYSPAAGTELSTGTHTLSVTFTPADPANYNGAAASVMLLVNERGQSIWFPPIGDRWYKDRPVPLGATASSGLPVSYRVVAGPATVSGSILTITGPGRITVRASQGGGGEWEAAPDVEQSFVAGYRTEILAGQGLTVWIDDRAIVGGSAFIWEPGTTHRIAVLPFQSQMPGSGFRFASWSDGGAREHAITALASDAAYTASFVLQFELSVSVRPDASVGTVVPGSGFFDAGTTVALEARPNAGYHFVGYSGDIEGSSAVMTGPRSVIATFAAGPVLQAVADSASFRPGPLTPGGLFTAFGSGLGGSTLVIIDSAGVTREAKVLYSSATQVNFITPEGLAPGSAVLRYTGADGLPATLAVEIAAVAPGLFSANMDGRGAPAGQVMRVNAAGEAVFSGALARCGAAAGSCECEPIDLGGPTDQVFVVLYGTGFRGYNSIRAVIGGVEAEVAWAGAQPTLPGVDQINLRLPRVLASRGEVELAITVNGRPANALELNIR